MLRNTICLGVAGNFAHHLEQAGELNDFRDVDVEAEDAPKGIFPFYIPGSDTFLGVYPISKTRLVLPEGEENAQLEPEIGILFDVVYGEDQTVTDLIARQFTVFNDTTIRRDGALKISEKKSWHEHSKGKGDIWIEIDRFEPGGVMDSFYLRSYLVRDGFIHPYGADVPLTGYSYFYGKLTRWLVDRINHQQDTGSLENIAEIFAQTGYPPTVFVSIGATEYTEFGRTNYLQPGDYVVVEAYDLDDPNRRILLNQEVVAHADGVS